MCSIRLSRRGWSTRERKRVAPAWTRGWKKRKRRKQGAKRFETLEGWFWQRGYIVVALSPRSTTSQVAEPWKNGWTETAVSSPTPPTWQDRRLCLLPNYERERIRRASWKRERRGRMPWDDAEREEGRGKTERRRGKRRGKMKRDGAD